MDARRARILAGSAFLMSLLAATWAGPAAAADCALSAPAYVNVGTPLSIEGSGFPASTSVDIAFSIDGAPTDAFTVPSTSSGALQIALTPEDIDVGATTVQATAGSACTAQVTYTVLAAGATPPPSAEPEASTGTGGAATAPRTDAEADVRGDGRSGAAMWLALALVAVGSSGLFLTRSTRRR